MADDQLILKYRPQIFGELMGHEAIVAGLQRVLKSSTAPHAYLLTGPSGIGKTTIARILAKELDAEVLEFDAASNSGIDAIKEIVELGQYMPMGAQTTKVLIIDECHSLSKTAWQALLKMVEEPPEHLYFALCTTELQKVPETIVNRCYHVALKALKPSEIEDLLITVCDIEGWAINPDVMQVVVQGATGQPRKALSMLQAVWDAPSRDEAARILTLLGPSEPLIDLLNALIGGKGWTIVKPLLERLDNDAFDEGSVLAGRYIIGAMLKEKDEKRAARIWSLLDALLFPSASWDKKAQFVVAIGRMLWSQN